jgi:hypothetical protein
MLSVAAAMACSSAPSLAATILDINSTITNAGTCSYSPTSPCPENYTVSTVPGSTTQSVTGSASFGFSDSFNQGTNLYTGSDLGPSATGSTPPWNFQDNILYTSTAATVQAQVSGLTANLSGVSNLQVRIISLTDPSTGNPFAVTGSAANTNANAMALLGGSSVVTIENGWTNINAGPVNYSATMLSNIAAGSYILQIRGEAVGASSYSGTIQFTAVPLPGSLILLLSGLGLLGVSTRRGKHIFGSISPA